MKDVDEMPNFLLVKDALENPEDIIDNYTLKIFKNKNNMDVLREIIVDFFDEVYTYAAKDILITQAKTAIYNLELIENGFEEDEDE